VPGRAALYLGAVAGLVGRRRVLRARAECERVGGHFAHTGRDELLLQYAAGYFDGERGNFPIGPGDFDRNGRRNGVDDLPGVIGDAEWLAGRDGRGSGTGSVGPDPRHARSDGLFRRGGTRVRVAPRPGAVT
jgi:hypothetical protein